MAHSALFFDDDDDLVGQCVPFITEAFSAAQTVLLLVLPHVRSTIDAALGDDAGRLKLVADAQSFWQGGHQTLMVWDAMFRQLHAEGRPWRVVTQPFWIGQGDGQGWHRIESATNRIYETLPYFSLCLHDTRQVPAAALEEVRRTHPFLNEGAGQVPSPNFVPPERFIHSRQPPWSDPPSGAASLAPAQPRDARLFATAAAARARLAARCDDVVLAVNEVVTNSFEAGGCPVMTAWTDHEHLVVEVADDAGGLTDPLTGYRPPNLNEESGRGLWLTWAVADDAALRAQDRGTAIRMYFRLR